MMAGWGCVLSTPREANGETQVFVYKVNYSSVKREKEPVVTREEM